MPNYDDHTLVGHLGRDPETRQAAGKNVTEFSLAVSAGKRGAEVTTWYRVTAWDKLGDLCAQYLAKGRPVLVKGRGLRLREYTDRQGTARTSLEITADSVVFLGEKGEGRSPSHADTGLPPTTPGVEDDLPF